MEAMDLSLDDIIKSKKPTIPKVNGKPGFRPRTNTYPTPTIRKPQIEDARSKIIQKNRAKIRDVRDLISAKKKPADARYVITKNMTDRLGKMGIAAAARALPRPRRHDVAAAYEYEQDPYHMLDARSEDYLMPVHFSPTKQRQSQYAKSNYTSRAGAYHDLDLLEPPRRRSYVDYDAVEDTQPLSSREAPEFDMLFKEYMSTKQGGSSAPPPPRYKPSSTMDEDVFDLYEAPSRDRRPLPPPPAPSSSQRRFIPPEETHLSYEMRSRLEGSQSQPKSMGIFANPTKPLTQTSSKGYRVMVTNLHSSVTVWDIQELFADIGGLLSAEIVKPGVAEVVYKTMKDAEDAVEVYHNRQLDGQPMKCHMITPTVAPLTSMHRSSSTNMRKAPLELDLDTLHSALFTSKRH